MKNVIMLTIAGLLLACGWGCSMADDHMEERKAAREEKAAKAKLEAEESARAHLAEEKETRRAAQGREDTVKDEVSLDAENPSAWFHETDEAMKEIRKRLVAAISKLDQFVARYEGKAETAAARGRSPVIVDTAGRRSRRRWSGRSQTGVRSEESGVWEQG